MDKYEISIWEDYLDQTPNGKQFLNERKIAVIGSNTMTAQARALEPNLIEEINGTHTFYRGIHGRSDTGRNRIRS